MTSEPLHIQRIDSRRGDARGRIAALRSALSPRGDVVSEAGRRRTIEVCGQELSPLAVVERICRDVREQGLKAVLDYSARIDKAPLTAQTLRVTAAELEAANRQVDPAFMATIRR